MKVEFYEGTDGKWYWRIVASNGRVIADGSEGYHSESNAKRAFARVKKLLAP
jgi:uncharacterized protein YegP (UPF0339 family)